jgi:hypothetical protein
MKPSIGRIVHFVQDKPEVFGSGCIHLPAIITAVWGDTCVNLQVFTDGYNSEGVDSSPGIKLITSSMCDETTEPAPRTWHWPERV